MKQIVGDLWEIPAQVKCIMTNGMYSTMPMRASKIYRAVMGKGTAKDAADMWPGLNVLLGTRIHDYGSRVFCFDVPLDLRETFGTSKLVTFPTKIDWRDPSRLDTIRHSTVALQLLSFTMGWTNILLPQPGTGAGGLAWSDVEKILISYFDDRFTIISRE